MVNYIPLTLYLLKSLHSNNVIRTSVFDVYLGLHFYL